MNDDLGLVPELPDEFRDEAACWKYLAALRWRNRFTCPRCRGRRGRITKRRSLYRCCDCNYQASVIAGTLFADTNKPLRLWFQALWYVTNQKNGSSALGLQQALGLGSYRTAWNWLHKLRRAMVRPEQDRLSGIVGADVLRIGKSLVVVLVQETPKGIGRIRLVRVPNLSAASLESAVQQTVDVGSTVRTKTWRDFWGLPALGYPADVTPARAWAVGQEEVFRVATRVERWLSQTHHDAVRPTHLDYYLDEFTFRFNRQTRKPRLLFDELLKHAVTLKPVLTRSLVGGRQPTTNR